MKKIKQLMQYPVVVACAMFAIIGCGGMVAAYAGKPSYQKEQERISDQIASQLTKAVPYPIAQMRDSLERRQLKERLLRFNKPSKTGYLYVFVLGSREPVGYYVIKGKISSVQSAMTNPDQTWAEDGDCSGCANYGNSAESIGDDGSWGNNEGGDDGIFFFDAGGVMHELAGLAWHYSDAPIAIWENTPKLNGKGAPSSTAGGIG